MILVAIGIKCLDPVLTIASCLARDDPFLVPAAPDQRQAALKQKYQLAADQFSDHLALLKAYQLWERAGDDARKRQAIIRYLVSFINLSIN